MGGQGSGNRNARGTIGNKGGRKPSPNPKSGHLPPIRMSPETETWVNAKAEECGKKPSTWVRDVLDGLRAIEGHEEMMWQFFLKLIYHKKQK